MEDITIKNCKVLIGNKFENNLNVSIKDNVISYVGKLVKDADILIDCKNKILAPGYIDIHTHGALNHDSLENSEEAHILISQYHSKNGTTAYCPTFVAASLSDMEKANKLIYKLSNEKKLFSRIIGVHVEGTFCSYEKKGAQDPKYLLDFNEETKKFFKDNSYIIKRITLAPNIKNSKEITKYITKLGIQVSLGHDDSYEEEINNCIKNGANSITHLFNQSSTMKRINGIKKLGLTEIGLINKDLYVEIIADSYHVPNSILNLLKTTKGLKKIIPVSDSIALAGLDENDTSYMDILNKKRPIKIKNGVGVLIDSNTTAGSITNIASIIKNFKNTLSLKNEEAIKLGFEPAIRLLNLKKIGKIKQGYYADLNILDENLNVELTIANGKII